MRIFRFDSEVSLPVSEDDSRFRLSPLVASASRATIDVMHLPAGGRIGRPKTGAPQLLAVVSGSGWASGSDGGRRDLGVGFAALWDADEQMEVESQAGLMGIRVEGTFEVLAMSVTRPIEVREYDPAWPEWFERVGVRVWPAIQDVALRIDHVGSTAVPGLAAKPIIDMDIVVRSYDDIQPVIDRLSRAGYRWRGDLGVAGREAFELVADEGLPEHHLYLVVENSRAHQDHWLLRDLLRSDAIAGSVMPP